MQVKDSTQGAVESVTADVELSLAGRRLRMKLTVPTGPTTWRLMLPLVQDLTNRVVDAAVQEVEEQGQRVSCKKGCGACCRQLVPISEVEARGVRDLVEDLPEPRRTRVRTRFAEARERLEQAGLLEQLERASTLAVEERHTIGLQYFHLGIACPFLEEESCSIHPDRPIACREYLVTSPAENCALPTAETVRMVKLPLKVSTAWNRLTSGAHAHHPIGWVPLILAPDWAEAHPGEPAPRPGPEWVEQLLGNLTRTALPS
jgi:Fe-S-cluster containining protein